MRRKLNLLFLLIISIYNPLLSAYPQTLYLHGEYHKDPTYQKKKKRYLNLAQNGEITLGLEGKFYNTTHKTNNQSIIGIENFDTYYLSFLAKHTYTLHQHLIKKYYYEHLITLNPTKDSSLIAVLCESYEILGDRNLREYIASFASDIHTYLENRPYSLQHCPSYNLKDELKKWSLFSSNYPTGSIEHTFYQNRIHIEDHLWSDFLINLTLVALENSENELNTSFPKFKSHILALKETLNNLCHNKIHSDSDYFSQMELFKKFNLILVENFRFELREIAMVHNIVKILNDPELNKKPLHIIVGNSHVKRIEEKLLQKSIHPIIIKNPY